MMDMKLLAVDTPPSIYHGFSTRKTFWEENFTGEENFTLGEFSAVNMKKCGRRNIRRNIDIKGSGKYVTLDILLKFGSIDKMRITSSDSKDNSGISVKGLITSLVIKVKTRPKTCKNSRYAIINFSMKDLSKVIREFENSHYKIYVRKSPKHEPTNSYFYLAIQLAKCMTRADALKPHIYTVRKKMTGTKQITILHIFSTDESKSKDFLVEKTLSQVCSTDKYKSKGIIVDESSTEERESKCVHININK